MLYAGKEDAGEVARASSEFDFSTAARFPGEGNGDWYHPSTLQAAGPAADARLKAYASMKEVQKREAGGGQLPQVVVKAPPVMMDISSSKGGEQQQQAGGMWKWPVYPGTPSRSFGQQQTGTMLEKRLGMQEGGTSVPQRYGGAKFATGIALKPPPSKWDDAEKWLVNTGGSPAHPQLQLQQQSKLQRNRGSSSVVEISDSELGSGRIAEFAFPSAAAPAPAPALVPPAPTSTTSTSTSPPPKYKHTARRSAGTSGRFLPVPVEEMMQVKTEVAKRTVRLSQEVVRPEAVGRENGEHEGASSNSRQSTEDGTGNSGGSEAFKDKFADPVVEQAAASHGRSFSDMPAPEAVSHRDMGTQMTPIPSQRASRCGTPGRADSPSRHNTPARRSASLGSICLDLIELQSCHLAKLEVRQLSGENQSNALRRALDQGGSTNWTTKEEEEEEISKSLRQIDFGEVRTSVIEARTTAWLEAEQAKYMARFKREEMKIQAWENHKRAQAEAEMKRLEVQLERMKAQANEKAMNRLVSARRRAEDMRVLAQAEKSEAAAKTALGAQRIRDTGQIPQPCSCFSWCGY